MLNIESIDKTSEGNEEISFSDDNADLVLKVIISKESLKELMKEKEVRKQETERIIKIIDKKKIWRSSNEKINDRLKYYNQALEELKEELEAELL